MSCKIISHDIQDCALYCITNELNKYLLQSLDILYQSTRQSFVAKPLNIRLLT